MDAIVGVTSGLIYSAVKQLLQNYIAQQIAAQEEIALESNDPGALPPDVPLDTRKAIGNFASRSEGFTVHLSDCVETIKRYIRKPEPKRPLNILLAAPPGSGKSFLIKEMTNELNSQLKNPKDVKYEVRFQEIYIPSLSSRDRLSEILYTYCCDKSDSAIPLIFFDEADTLLDDEHIYPNFLAPMWDGNFIYQDRQNKTGKTIFSSQAVA